MSKISTIHAKFEISWVVYNPGFSVGNKRTSRDVRMFPTRSGKFRRLLRKDPLREFGDTRSERREYHNIGRGKP